MPSSRSSPRPLWKAVTLAALLGLAVGPTGGGAAWGAPMLGVEGVEQ